MSAAIVTCALCDEQTDDVFEHLRVMHPATWDDMEKWPDGGLVVAPFVEDCTGDENGRRSDG